MAKGRSYGRPSRLGTVGSFGSSSGWYIRTRYNFRARAARSKTIAIDPGKIYIDSEFYKLQVEHAFRAIYGSGRWWMTREILFVIRLTSFGGLAAIFDITNTLCNIPPPFGCQGYASE
jgi:hypothetical protein